MEQPPNQETPEPEASTKAPKTPPSFRLSGWVWPCAAFFVLVVLYVPAEILQTYFTKPDGTSYPPIATRALTILSMLFYGLLGFIAWRLLGRPTRLINGLLIALLLLVSAGILLAQHRMFHDGRTFKALQQLKAELRARAEATQKKGITLHKSAIYSQYLQVARKYVVRMRGPMRLFVEAAISVRKEGYALHLDRERLDKAITNELIALNSIKSQADLRKRIASMAASLLAERKTYEHEKRFAQLLWTRLKKYHGYQKQLRSLHRDLEQSNKASADALKHFKLHIDWLQEYYLMFRFLDQHWGKWKLGQSADQLELGCATAMRRSFQKHWTRIKQLAAQSQALEKKLLQAK